MGAADGPFQPIDRHLPCVRDSHAAGKVSPGPCDGVSKWDSTLRDDTEDREVGLAGKRARIDVGGVTRHAQGETVLFAFFNAFSYALDPVECLESLGP